MFFVESSNPILICPHCGGRLFYRDSRKRICKKEGGEKNYLMIRRLYCKDCCSYHNELPDCLVPFKHYSCEVISGVLDNIISSSDEDSEDYPCQETMNCWRLWFFINQEVMEESLRHFVYVKFSLDVNSLLSFKSITTIFRSIFPNWLEKILQIIYNNGDFLLFI